MSSNITSVLMYTTHSLGSLTLQLFDLIKSHVCVADFCAIAAAVEFAANDGLLENDLVLFKLSFPGFELEARCREGMVFIRRNGLHRTANRFVEPAVCMLPSNGTWTRSAAGSRLGLVIRTQ